MPLTFFFKYQNIRNLKLTNKNNPMKSLNSYFLRANEEAHLRLKRRELLRNVNRREVSNVEIQSVKLLRKFVTVVE